MAVKDRVGETALLSGPATAVAAVLAAISIVAAFAGEGGALALRLEPARLAAQPWRVVSGHFVHLGVAHLALNLVGLALVWLLVGATARAPRWVLIAVVLPGATTAGLLWLAPALDWYVGLSGVLHGLAAAGVVMGFDRRSPELAILGAGLVAKLVYEQIAGPLPGSEASAGGPVIVDAHLAGALAGAALGSAFRFWDYRRARV